MNPPITPGEILLEEYPEPMGIPDFFPMTIQLREIAVVLKTRGVKNLLA